jgi:hypothetical protein
VTEPRGPHAPKIPAIGKGESSAGRDGDPLQIPEDPATLRRLLPHIESAYARAGERRASEDFIHGFLKGLHRRDRNRRRERHFWLAVLLVITAYAFLAGRTSAAPWPGPHDDVPTSAGDRTGAPPPAGLAIVPSDERPSSGVEGSGAPSPTGEIGEPAAYCKPGYCETPSPRPRPIVPRGTAGEATWWASFGSGLYAAIRPDLGAKGDTAIVCGGSPFHCLTLPIITTCACLGPNSDRLIDLSIDAFRSFADPSAGVVRITLQVLDR